MDVSDKSTSLWLPLNMVQQGEHTIDDELVFSNKKGYVFHDSRGIESGSTEELEILQEFIQRRCGERRLPDRLHAIWSALSGSSVYEYEQLKVISLGTVCQWTTNDHSLISDFTRTSVLIRMVRRYKCS